MELVVHLPIRMGLVVVDDVLVGETATAYDALEACAAGYLSLGVTSAGSVPGVDEARRLFRSLGIDPTRRRPSSESLLRRAIKGLPLPRINTLVDVGNWCSLDFLLPLGLYDTQRIRGDVELRRGIAGDEYEAIGDKTIDLEGRYVLADDAGAFGSPMTDSKRTAVSTTTTSTVVMLYATREYDAAKLEEQTATLASRIVDGCGGRCVECRVVEGR